MKDPINRSAVLAQYSECSGAPFYRSVMGGGGPAIHYGLYACAETPMREAVAASTLAMLALAGSYGRLGQLKRLIDLGAGAGGSAHVLAERMDAHVTCVDLCAHLNEQNLRAAREIGLSGRIGIWQGSFDSLPVEWAGRFDLAWSQDAFCHAHDKAEVLREARRVLKSGGLLVFSDILRDQAATPADVAAFTGVNAVNSLATASEYTVMLREAGFDLLASEDWSDHLPANFRSMHAQLERCRERLLDAGVDRGTIDRFALSLQTRLNWPAGSVMRWQVFVGRAVRSA